MEEFLVFGDIAGRYDEMLKIIEKAPNVTPVSVGDMIDRGPKSKQVLEFFAEKGVAVFANHEHLFLDWVYDRGFYDAGVWGSHMNGAFATMQSFGCDNCLPAMKHTNRMKIIRENKDLLDWLATLPMYIESEKYIITHAPINPSIPFKKTLQVNWPNLENTLLWNIGDTRRRKDGKLQIHGHVARKNATLLSDKAGVYGVNVDSSKGHKLTAMHYPTFKLYEQAYL
jgi:serine/threonine protein phosphatase 1